MSRLEDIENNARQQSELTENGIEHQVILKLDDYISLHHQAQKAEELQAKVDELEKELEFYADRNSYTEKVSDEWGSATAILQDRGERARQALKGVEG